MKATLRRALRFAKRNKLPEERGFVIFANGNPVEWRAELGAPEISSPGCIAISLWTGSRYLSEGGSIARGAEKWSNTTEVLTGKNP